MKKVLSVLLCLVLVAGTAFSVISVNAASASNSTGYNQKTTLENEDDFTWDNASVYFLMTDRFITATQRTTIPTDVPSIQAVSLFRAGTHPRVHSTAVTSRVLHRKSKRDILTISV